MTESQLLFLIIGLLCCSIILLIIITVKVYVSKFANNKLKSNFANYNALSQDKSLESLVNNANKRDILNLPMHKFYFNTSHNSYLSGGAQILSSGNSADSVTQALKGGARFIELDIYPDPNGINPQVAHKGDGKAYTNIVNLDTHLKAIRDNGFTNTNDPLIIGLELYDYANTTHMQKVTQLFKDYLGDRLYNPSLMYSNPSDANAWPRMPIKDTLGKIIVLVPGFGVSEASRNNYDNYLRGVAHGRLDINLPYKEPSASKTIWNTLTFQTVPGKITYNLNTDAHTLKPDNKFSRIYPYNIIWSDNVPPGEMWACNHNAVAENFNSSNVSGLGNIYLNKFKYSNIVPIDYVIQNERSIYQPTRINYKGYTPLLYENVTMDTPYLKSNTIYKNDVMWKSDNGKYTLKMQGDGNLVIYGGDWSTKTYTDSKNKNEGSYLFMQPDGNLVLYRGRDGKVLWKTGTSGNSGAFAYLHDDGALRVRNKGKTLDTSNAP